MRCDSPPSRSTSRCGSIVCSSFAREHSRRQVAPLGQAALRACPSNRRVGVGSALRCWEQRRSGPPQPLARAHLAQARRLDLSLTMFESGRATTSGLSRTLHLLLSQIVTGCAQAATVVATGNDALYNENVLRFLQIQRGVIFSSAIVVLVA